MPLGIQIGTILIKEEQLKIEKFAVESNSYLQDWSLVRAVNGFSFAHRVRAADWNGFFMAPEVQGSAFGSIRAGSLEAALQRIFLKVRGDDFNCLEVECTKC